MKKRLAASLLSAITLLGAKAGAVEDHTDSYATEASKSRDIKGDSKDKALKGQIEDSVSFVNGILKSGKHNETKKGASENGKEDSTSVEQNDESKNKDQAKNVSSDLSSNKENFEKKQGKRSFDYTMSTVEKYNESIKEIENDPELVKMFREDYSSRNHLGWIKGVLPYVPLVAPFVAVPFALGGKDKSSDDKTKIYNPFKINAITDPITALTKKSKVTVGDMVRAWVQYLQNCNRGKKPENKIGTKAYADQEQKKKGKDFDDSIDTLLDLDSYGDLKAILNMLDDSLQLRSRVLANVPGGILGPAYYYKGENDAEEMGIWSKLGYIAFKNFLNCEDLQVYDISEALWNHVLDNLINYYMKDKTDVSELAESIYRFVNFFIGGINIPMVGDLGGYGLISDRMLGANLIKDPATEKLKIEGKGNMKWSSAGSAVEIIEKTILKPLVGDKGKSVGGFFKNIKEIIGILLSISPEFSLSDSTFSKATKATKLLSGSVGFTNIQDVTDLADRALLTTRDKEIEKKCNLIDAISKILDPNGDAVNLLKIIKKHFVPNRDALRTVDIPKLGGLIDALMGFVRKGVTKKDVIKAIEEVVKMLQG